MKESQAMFTGYEDKYPKLHAAIQHILDYLRLDVASKTKRIQAIENDLKKNNINALIEHIKHFHGEHSSELRWVKSDLEK
jgi:hypothetical protein